MWRKDNDLVDGMVLKLYQNLLDTKVEVDVGDIPPKIVAIRRQTQRESDVVFDFKVSLDVLVTKVQVFFRLEILLNKPHKSVIQCL